MAIYERGAGAHVAERVQVTDGSDEQDRYERLVKDGGNWRRVDDEPAEADEPKRPAKTTSRASKSGTSRASGGE